MSASRIRTPSSAAWRRWAPASPTSDQSPPETVSTPKRQRSNVLPTSLHSLNESSKNEQPANVQLRKAASTWVDALKSQSRNVHSEKTAPRFVDSVSSAPVNLTWEWLWPERSWPYQSAF